MKSQAKGVEGRIIRYTHYIRLFSLWKHTERFRKQEQDCCLKLKGSSFTSNPSLEELYVWITPRILMLTPCSVRLRCSLLISFTSWQKKLIDQRCLNVGAKSLPHVGLISPGDLVWFRNNLAASVFSCGVFVRDQRDLYFYSNVQTLPPGFMSTGLFRSVSEAKRLFSSSHIMNTVRSWFAHSPLASEV